MPLRLLILLLFLSLPVFLPAQEDYRNPDVGIKFPETLAGMALVKITNYEEQTPGLGVGASYRAEKQKADLYLYTGGLENASDGIEASETQKHFKQIIGDVLEMEKQGLYENVKIIIPMEKVQIGTLPFFHAEVRFTHQKIERSSHLYLSVLKNRFIKIRFTYYSSEPEAGAKALEELLKALGNALSPKPV